MMFTVCGIKLITAVPIFTELVEEVKHGPRKNLSDFGSDLININKKIYIILHGIWRRFSLSRVHF